MEAADLCAQFPALYHMAPAEAWRSIWEHGLLPTRTLVERYADDEGVRRQLLTRVRQRSVTLTHPERGSVSIRDQRPAKFLERCLTEDSSVQQFLDALNDERVFFWPSLERLERLLAARAYRNQEHVVLQVDTTALLERYGDRVELAPYNTGSMHVPNAPQRSHMIFSPVLDYPYEEWLRKRRRPAEALVEVTVVGGVDDVTEVARSVELRRPGCVPEQVWPVPRKGRS